jgi:hypothetical protein
MAYSVILHIENTDPVLGEVEEVPSPTDTLIVVNNPRRRDGKDLHFISENVVTVVWPVARLNFIEILSGGEDEEIIGFVRE